MHAGFLEHLNITVTNPQKTASLLCKIFDWKIRWSGPSSLGGSTVHVGTDNAYLALYSPASAPQENTGPRKEYKNALNHIGIVVDDIKLIEERIQNAGYKPYAHEEYEPGKRFYFFDNDGVEYEVVSYS